MISILKINLQISYKSINHFNKLIKEPIIDFSLKSILFITQMRYLHSQLLQ